MTNQTLVVSIGRGDLPLETWDDFCDDIVLITDTLAKWSPEAQVVFRGQGVGIWEDEEEVAYTVILANVDPTYVIYLADRDLTLRVWFEERIAARRDVYDQDAIAVTWGITDLI